MNIFYILYFFNMSQLIKRCVMLSLIWTSAIVLSWCTWFSKSDNKENHENKNTEITMKNENTIQPFETLVLSTNEKIWKKVTEIFEQTNKYLTEKKIKSETKWNITISYWDTVWTLTFDSLWKIDKTLNKLFWKLDLWVEWKNLESVWSSMKNMKAKMWVEWILWWKTSFVKFNDWEFWWLEMFILPQWWEKLLKKIKNKWIRFHWKTLCKEWHKDYSQEWCEISKQLSLFKDQFIQVISESWEVKSKNLEAQKRIQTIIEEWIKESITNEILIKWEETTIDWKSWYKFDIKKDLLKEKIIETAWKIFDEVMNLQKDNYVNNLILIWGVNTSEDFDEIKKETKTEFIEWLNQLEIKDFEWYLIDSWNWNVDVEIKNITFWVKNDEKIENNNEKENCWEEENWTCELNIPKENKRISDTELKLWFSTLKKEFRITTINDWKEVFEMNFKLENTDEWFKFSILISPSINWKKLENSISIVSVNSFTKWDNIDEWNSHNMITINKELWSEWWFFELKHNIIVKFDYESKTDFNWFEDITNPKKSISFSKIERDMKKLENKNDVLQEKIDWNLEIKNKDIKK